MLGTVLITGAAGFIGTHAARHFTAHGWQVVGVDQSSAPPPDCHFFYTLRLPDATLDAIIRDHQPDLCLHCAGNALVPVSMENPRSDFQSSVPVTFHLLDSIRQHAPDCRVIFFSSAAVYGNPTCLPIDETQPVSPLSPYGYHKHLCEQLCQEFSAVFGLQTASIRIFSAYGPGLRKQVIWDTCHKCLNKPDGSLTLFGTGDESRDFIHITDILCACESIASKAPMQGEVYNVASGEAVTIRTLAEALLRQLEFRGALAFDGQVPPGTPLKWQADILRIRNLGFQPSVPLVKGLAETAEWCRSMHQRSLLTSQ